MGTFMVFQFNPPPSWWQKLGRKATTKAERPEGETMKGDNLIDSRDIIARIEELREERGDLIEAIEDAKQELMDADNEDRETALDSLRSAESALSDWDGEELKELEDLAEECEGSDWTYGVTLIREDYFPEYCEELLADIGDIPRDLPGYIVIDWEATAENLAVDYSLVSFGGYDYYLRG